MAAGTAYRLAYRALLRRLDAETAHRLGLGALRGLGAVPRLPELLARRGVPTPPVHALGLTFTSPLGVAAGLDKNAVAVDALAALGFGFVEVGTVTARPQPGNPRPRLFRLPTDDALLNRMGFNNEGAAVVAERLRRRARRRAARPAPPVVLGVNIGRSRAAGDDEAVADYVASARLLAPLADYLVVNVSSPNTPGLRDLQAVARLRPLLAAVREVCDDRPDRPVPLLVKIAPDLADQDIDAIADMTLECGIAGIVATNTTISRDGLRADPARVAALGSGGVSGAPLRERSLQVLERLRTRVGDRLVLISAGGIASAAEARRRRAAGATLVQAYTAFVYQGPSWPRSVLRELGEW